MIDEKEGACSFIYVWDKITEVSNEKDITTIVDVDDKNCLAELTVALKLNHGVRQWP